MRGCVPRWKCGGQRTLCIVSLLPPLCGVWRLSSAFQVNAFTHWTILPALLLEYPAVSSSVKQEPKQFGQCHSSKMAKLGPIGCCSCTPTFGLFLHFHCQGVRQLQWIGFLKAFPHRKRSQVRDNSSVRCINSHNPDHLCPKSRSWRTLWQVALTEDLLIETFDATQNQVPTRLPSSPFTAHITACLFFQLNFCTGSYFCLKYINDIFFASLISVQLRTCMPLFLNGPWPLTGRNIPSCVHALTCVELKLSNLLPVRISLDPVKEGMQLCLYCVSGHN